MTEDGSESGGFLPQQDGDAWAQRVSRGVARGERTALSEFYQAWFDRSLASARRTTGRDESFCLDVVQDAMVKAASGLRGVGSSAELAAWMERVVRSCALDRLRAESARTRRERSASAQERQPASAERQRIGWLDVELAGAAPIDRDLVRHRIVEGATLEQAAFAAGISGPAAHGRLRRLLGLLRKARGDKDGKGRERDR